MYLCMCVCVCVCVHTQTHTLTHSLTHTCLYTHTHMCIYRWLWKGGAVGMAVLIVVVFGIGPLSSAAHDSM